MGYDNEEFSDDSAYSTTQYGGAVQAYGAVQAGASAQGYDMPAETAGGSAEHYQQLQAQLIAMARERLSEHQTLIVQAVGDFRSHVYTETEGLEGQAPFEFASVINGLVEVVGAFFFPEAELAVAAVKAFADVFGEQLQATVDHTAERQVAEAKDRLRHCADLLSQAAGQSARAGWSAAVSHLSGDGDAAMNARPDLYSASSEAIGQLCDIMGIPDPQSYSPYNHVRQALEGHFANVLAHVKTELKDGDTEFWQLVADDRGKRAQKEAESHDYDRGQQQVQ